MQQENILLARIDNRLVHGQVGMTWVNTLGANLVVVANDEVAEDSVQQNLMEMVIPETTGIRFFTLDKTIKIIDKSIPSQRILLVIRTPQDALKLIKGGVKVDTLNIGNLHFSEGKKQLSETVSVDQNDVDTFKELHDLGVNLEVQGIPNEGKKDLMKLLKNV